MNWLITGGCGFIGKNLIKFLSNQDDDNAFRIIDNESVGTREDLYYAVDTFYVRKNVAELKWEKNKLEFYSGDILDEQLATIICSNADIIVHLAANTGVGPSVNNPRMDCTTNVLGTFNYLEACRMNGVRRFIFASSGAPIGECTPPIHEELPCHPVSPYGASKLAGEAYCSTYFRTFSVETVALRFGNVYGPGSSHKSSVVAKFIRQATNRESLEIYGDGTQTRDFIYIDDLLNAIWLAVNADGVGGEIFQIATSRETTVLEVTEKLLDVLKSFGYSNVHVVHGPKRLGDVMRNYSDTRKAKEKLNWVCHVSLKSGIERVVEWFLREKK